MPKRVTETPPEALRRLEFTVMRKLDGFLFGDYRGLFYGPSLDLAEVREYQPGDEVRRLDWNVTARTGKLHVREYREERELTAWIIVDDAPSMRFGTRLLRKDELAADFAGLSALVITRHGDKIGVFTPGGGPVVPPGSGRARATRVVEALGRLAPTPGATLTFGLERFERTCRRRSLVFVVSDFLDAGRAGAPPAWVAPLNRLAIRHEVVAVRVSDVAERVLPAVGMVRFRDPGGQELELNTSDAAIRAAHGRLVAERDAALTAILRGARVPLLELRTDADLTSALLAFSARRKAARA